MTTLFFELLQVAIGNKRELSQAPTAVEWQELYALAQKQTLVGIAFRGIERLPAEQRPPKSLLMQWMMATERIKAMNADLDRKALAVANKFLEEGFPGVVLKGQGVAKLYRETHPNPPCKGGDAGIADGHPNTQHSTLNTHLSSYRTPGDIDIWLQGGRENILGYVRQYVPDCKPVFHNVNFPVVEGMEIEVHFTPSWMNSPVTNRRLQRFFRESADALFTKNDNADENDNCHPEEEFSILNSQFSISKYSKIPSPSLAFNRVYILVHIYRHLFGEGIGLRQLLDYYFVLSQGFTEEERAETMHTLHSLKMQRFTAAVMWVLQAVYGMDGRYMLTEPDEREGRFLLNEIMLAGNLGHYDERIKRVANESALRVFVRRVMRNFRFVRSYPSEVLWSPIFKLWHYFWRKRL